MKRRISQISIRKEGLRMEFLWGWKDLWVIAYLLHSICSFGVLGVALKGRFDDDFACADGIPPFKE